MYRITTLPARTNWRVKQPIPLAKVRIKLVRGRKKLWR